LGVSLYNYIGNAIWGRERERGGSFWLSCKFVRFVKILARIVEGNYMPVFKYIYNLGKNENK
jgi:hypothetical protein